ncbi:RNA 2'-phosphotransferase [Actinopolymorpha sp. B17G11]|uniref:RNA 2'-phosphotransferase n=1 Tax=unclassified Actinopolymorpha TaxID=2627063 RepID=UPI0032D9497E
MTEDRVAASKFLAYVLRHNPAAIDISLDPSGWISIDTLLAALEHHGRPIDRKLFDQLVAGTDKKRFEVLGTRVRAAQGHSINIDLQLDATEPPAVLYHGTVDRFLPSILTNGLRPQQRTHVHLSPDPATAHTVAARRGKPVILTIDAAGMYHGGIPFYQAANGTWLTNHVPPNRIHLHKPTADEEPRR